MADFTEILKKSDLKSGQMRAYGSGGREILIARVGDRFFAADNRCPHLGGKLSEGRLDGTIVTCPKHASRFDLSDGRVIQWTDWSGMKLGIAKLLKGPRPIEVHQVKVDGDKVLVSI